MTTREEIRSEESTSGQDEDFNQYDLTQTVIPNQRAPRHSIRTATEQGISEAQAEVWRQEGGEGGPEILEAGGGQEGEVECLGGLQPTDPKENAFLEECMALVTAVKSCNPFGILQAEGFIKDKKTPFLKTRMAELLHLYQHAEYVDEEKTEDDRKIQSFLTGSLDAISYMKEVAESDRSTRTAAKQKASDMKRAQGAALRQISLRYWVLESDMNQEEGGGRIATSFHRVND
ncbi:hypothetical protein C7212DRAFT_342187 [Tuber magnatum]|uniref:Uncharacterized protein n=1 Tax=Tuber magnatum TaxID=42249 RepID=A0A317T1K2_9PEZI|nr:hypothetical protein C7212DRAFT_342187 [Tuber magnatum]